MLSPASNFGLNTFKIDLNWSSLANGFHKSNSNFVLSINQSPKVDPLLLFSSFEFWLAESWFPVFLLLISLNSDWLEKVSGENGIRSGIFKSIEQLVEHRCWIIDYAPLNMQPD